VAHRADGAGGGQDRRDRLPGRPRDLISQLPGRERDGRVALLTDFDGTIAPIVDDPADAVPLPEVVELLALLVPRLALTAVVSGRPVAFLQEQLPVPGLELVGHYGLERLVPGPPPRVVVDPRAAPWAGAVARAAEDAAARWPALFVERKGGVAVTLHWRRAPAAEPAAADLRALADRHGLALAPGRLAAELRPPVPVDKATAVDQLLDAHAPLDGVLFAGDDTGDVVVFDRLDAARRANPGLRVLCVGVRSDEAPAALLERADFVVDGPAGVAAVLAELSAALSPE
jgi:trehalose 6-phosphate phosphatase